MGGVYDEFNTKILGDGRQGDRHERRAELRLRHRHQPGVLRLQPAQPRRGPLARGDGEVVVDAGTADRRGLRGRRHGRDLDAPAEAGRSRSSASPSTATSSRSAARRSRSSTCRRRRGCFDREGQFDAISVAAAEGTTPEQLIAEIQPMLPGGRAGARRAPRRRRRTRTRSASSRRSSATSCSRSRASRSSSARS